MKRILRPLFMLSLLYLSSPSGIAQQNTLTTRPVISYQGLLTSSQNGQPLNGTHRIVVTLYGDEQGSIRVWEGSYQTELNNGVFSLQLGSGEYPLPTAKDLDRAMWLGVRVDDNEEMKPLSRLTSTLNALTVSDGSITKDKLATDYVAAIAVDGEKITGQGSTLNLVPGKGLRLDYDKTTGSVILSQDKSATKGDDDKPLPVTGIFWSEGGNFATNPVTDYVGTFDPTPLEIRVNGAVGQFSPAGDGRVMQYTPTALSPNLIGGHNANFFAAGINGATVGGGGTIGTPNSIGADFGTIAGGDGNTTTAAAFGGAIGGGITNSVADAYTTVAGGTGNNALGKASTVGGGAGNNAIIRESVISGGTSNTTNAQYSAIGGGNANTANGLTSTISGGMNNVANGQETTISGGVNNLADGQQSTIGGGSTNNATPAGFGGTIGGGITNSVADAYTTVGGGIGNNALGKATTVAGGASNNAVTRESAIGGGIGNTTNGQTSTIAGGLTNSANGQESSIGGGSNNTTGGNTSTIAGGSFNNAGGLSASIGGGMNNNAAGQESVISGGINNNAFGSQSSVGGGQQNNALATFSTIGGGGGNVISANESTIGGGMNNSANGQTSTISGGIANAANGQESAIGGGSNNVANAQLSAIGGGVGNFADGIFSTIPGGRGNNINNLGVGSTVGGGIGNSISDANSTIGGGISNTIVGTFSAIPGGQNLTISKYSFGFNGDFSGAVTDISAFPSTSLFNETDVWIGNVTGTPKQLRFYAPNVNPLYVGSIFSSFEASPAQAATINYTLPAAAPTAAGDVLTCTPAGVMSWAAPAAGTVTGSGTATRIAFWGPGPGVTSNLQDNANLYWNNTNSRLSVGAGVAPNATAHIQSSGAVAVSTIATEVDNINTSATAGISKIGLLVRSSGAWTGAGSTNLGLVVGVGGGTTNYAATFNGGTVGVGTTTPLVSMDVNGGLATRSQQVNVVAGANVLPGGAAIVDRSFFVINSNTIVVGAAVVAIPNGLVDGQMIKLVNRNAFPAAPNNTFRIVMNGATNIVGTGNFGVNNLDLDLHDSASFIWDATAPGGGKWVMLYFTNNP